MLKTVGNYLGQLRIYSLVDLILLFIAIEANNIQIIGGVLLHIAFLIYLETRHKHSYRASWPTVSWLLPGIIGIFLFDKLAGIGFILASYLYAQKNKGAWGISAPGMRALQTFFVIGGIIGYHNKTILIATSVLFIRNFLGDIRDVQKDRKEKMQTIPVLIGMKGSYKKIHLIGTLTTTLLWWSWTTLSIPALIGIWGIELITYHKTAR